MEPVGDHEAHAVVPGGLGHFLAVPFGQRHRLLAEDVDAGAGRRDRVVAVHVVGKRDVNRVDLIALQALPESLVGVRRGHAVFPGELLELLGRVGHERGELTVLLRAREGGKDGGLRDVAQSDNGVTDLATPTLHLTPIFAARSVPGRYWVLDDRG